jgi:UDPglucose 6-dehydrogenase
MLAGTKETALNQADALVIMTEWRQFKAPNFDDIKQTLKAPAIFDGRNLFEPSRMKERGIDYFGIGR